jgi:hypothetical protein
MGFIDRAERANPVGGEVFEFGAGGDTVVGVTNCGVIDITADIANILFHNNSFYMMIKLFTLKGNRVYCVACRRFGGD